MRSLEEIKDANAELVNEANEADAIRFRWFMTLMCTDEGEKRLEELMPTQAELKEHIGNGELTIDAIRWGIDYAMRREVGIE